MRIALLIGSYWLYFHTTHSTIGIILFILFLSGFLKPKEDCPGCPECDPQAFIGDDGEIHPGL